MKKAYILLSMLAVFCMLTLVSCRGLASSKPQTADFTYTIDDNLIRAITRSGTTPDNTPYTINITIKSKTGDAYSNSQTATGPLSTLKAKSFEFTDVPLNTPLVLTVTVYVNNKIVYSSKAKEFTLTSDAVTEIEAILNLELDTPMLTWVGNEDNQGNYYYCYTIQDTGTFESDKPIYDYCFDENNTMWYVDEVEWSLYSVTGTQKTKRLSLESYGDDTEGIFNVEYDSITGKLCLILFDEQYNSNTDSYDYTIYIASAYPEELLKFTEEPVEIESLGGKRAGIPFIDATIYDNELSWNITYTTDLQTYAYNGTLYIVVNLKNDAGKVGDCQIFKFSTKTGEMISYINLATPSNWNASAENAFSDFLKIMSEDELEAYWTNTDKVNSVFFDYDEYKEYYYSQYYLYDSSEVYTSERISLTKHNVALCSSTFTDMKLYGGDLFIPFNQYYIAEPYSYLFPPATYIDRGGVLVIDAETLKVKNVIGLEATKTNITSPIYVKYSDYIGSNYYKAPAYYDEDLHNPYGYKDIASTWAVGAKNECSLRYPEKIIAIKPKKLILADTGNYYYIDSDKAFHMGEGSRIVSVDLETFAVTVENDSSTIPARYLSEGVIVSDERTYCESWPNTVFGPEMRVDNGTVSYDYTDSHEFTSSVNGYLVAEVEFGHISN